MTTTGAGAASAGGAETGAFPDRVRQVLSEQSLLRVDAAGVGTDDDLYARGLTSHGSVRLMLALEDAFDAEIPTRLLNRASFASIGAIAAVFEEILRTGDERPS